MKDSCQRASDDYGITAFGIGGFEFAPQNVIDYWMTNNCMTKPSGGTPCQKASDYYGIAPGVTGFAPADVQAWWSGVGGCSTTIPSGSASVCQRISNDYGIVASGQLGFTFAPQNVITYWMTNKCVTSPPPGTSACQLASNFYGLVANSTVNGFAPADVTNWFRNVAKCPTVPTN
jgi:hypothetical protein